MSGIRDIDSWRKFHLAVAEFVDAWRIIPRAVVVFFGYAMYQVTSWYMNLVPYVLEGCVKAAEVVPAECIIQAPTTQHTALVSALFALSAAVFAFYSNNGRKWNGFSRWNKPEDEKTFTRAGEDEPVKGSRATDRQGVAIKVDESGGNGG